MPFDSFDVAFVAAAFRPAVFEDTRGEAVVVGAQT